MAVLIILMLGLIAGVLFHAFIQRFWIASTLAAASGVVLWVGGVCVFFAIFAPNELGPLLLGPILLALGTTFAGAMTAGIVVRAIRGIRISPGHCRCGYDLTGNTSGVCPECGARK